MVLGQEPELDVIARRLGEGQHRIEILPDLGSSAVQGHQAPVVGGRTAVDPKAVGKDRIDRDGQPCRPKRRILVRVVIRHGFAYVDAAPRSLEYLPLDGFVPLPKMGVSQQLLFFGGHAVDVDAYLSGTQPRQHVFGEMQGMDVERADALRQLGHEGGASFFQGVEPHLGPLRIVPGDLASRVVMSSEEVEVDARYPLELTVDARYPGHPAFMRNVRVGKRGGDRDPESAGHRHATTSTSRSRYRRAVFSIE